MQFCIMHVYCLDFLGFASLLQPASTLVRQKKKGRRRTVSQARHGMGLENFNSASINVSIRAIACLCTLFHLDQILTRPLVLVAALALPNSHNSQTGRMPCPKWTCSLP